MALKRRIRRNSFLIPLINKLLNGELSEDTLSLLNASRMALVPKGTDKNGNCKGLRPICIGECIYRIAARWVAYCISPIIKEHFKKSINLLLEPEVGLRSSNMPYKPSMILLIMMMMKLFSPLTSQMDLDLHFVMTSLLNY